MTTIGASIDPIRIDGSLDRLEQNLQAYQAIGLKAVELPVHGLDIILNGTLNPDKTRQVMALLSHFDFSYSIHSPNPVNLMDTRDRACTKRSFRLPWSLPGRFTPLWWWCTAAGLFRKKSLT